jgi:drug/metabolite transporter (DMT)-like permease
MSGGISIALVSAATFGLAGTLARALMDAGWSPGSAAVVRIGLSAAILFVPGLVALRGRWELVRRGAGLILMYGVAAVAGAQLAYFFAVQSLPVGVALLVEYTSPVAVVLWMWARHQQRPSKATLVGALVAAAGLAALLDIFSSGGLSLTGIAWALGAMVGAAVYFVISGDDSSGLPPVTLAAGGLLVASATLGLLAFIGVLPLEFSTADVQFSGFAVPWWVAAGALAIVTSSVAYVTGIIASRRLGARLASFVALSEVVAAMTFAWLLLDQQPLPVQILGAALVMAGVVIIKLGEPRLSEVNPEPEAPPLC